MATLTTVAIPVRNGGPLLRRTLEAVFAQRVEGELEVIVCDSGSIDGSDRVARQLGAEVLSIAPEAFGHGRTRNLLMARSAGSVVAFLTQDAVPADARWLGTLVSGLDLAPDVALTFGPYRPRPDASPMVARELMTWFAGLADNGGPRVERLDPDARRQPAGTLLGGRSFFTDANGAIRRSAWEDVPFQDVAYAEDQRLAIDMLRAGYAKAFVPGAVVVHSHDYTTIGWLRRSFDEARGLREVYGWAQPVSPRSLALALRGRVGADLRWVRSRSSEVLSPQETAGLLTISTVHHAARLMGSALGGRADRLPRRLVPKLSLEGRAR